MELSTRSFDTKGKATAFFKAILNRYRPGDRVSDGDARDLASLLTRHHEYEIKVGIGVDHFEVMMTEHGSQCFRIVRRDGTGTDFSYIRSIKNKPPAVKEEVSRAFRQVVKFDLYKARDEFYATHRDGDGLIVCAATGDRISCKDAHMDHRPPMTFEVIITTFLGSKAMAWEDVPLTSGQDNQVSPLITDSALWEAFRAYHAKVAVLDFVKDTIDLAQSSRNRLKKGRVKVQVGRRAN